jgi:hypothetical protein
MDPADLERQLELQQFPNGYALVNGVAMHAQNGEKFQIPPEVVKRHIRPGMFVELRIVSSRFSSHLDAPEECKCPSCNGDLSQPVLRHDHPSTLVPVPKQTVPSRGWGEDFWIQVTHCAGKCFRGFVDNPLIESRLHGLELGSEIFCHSDHILAVHDVHRQELIKGMGADDLQEFAAWLSQLATQ